MGDAYRELASMLRPAPIQVREGKVVAVATDKLSCDVLLDLDRSETLDVRLRSVLGGALSALVLVPTVGARVLVGIVNGNTNDCYLIQTNELEEAHLVVGSSKLVVTDAGVVLNDGQNGELLVASKLLAELQKVSAFLNTLKTAFETAVPAPGDGGAAIKTAVTAALGAAALPNWNGLTDSKVKH